MAREHWYFIAGMLAVLLPALALLAVKKAGLLDQRADRVIAYKRSGDRELALHAFFPAGNTAAPALLFFHGGSWLFGSPADFYPQCRFFAAQGYACFSAAYRLGSGGNPDVRGAIDDARDAFAYLQQHATELGLDRRRLFAGGGSSGGHLAAALGTGLPGGATAGERPAGLLLYNPMVDLAPCSPDHHLVADYWRAVSPLQHVDAATPPTLVLVGDRDPEVPVTTVEAFCSAVTAAGGRCEAEIYPGQGHGFFNAPQYRERTGRRALDFLASIGPQQERPTQ